MHGCNLKNRFSTQIDMVANLAFKSSTFWITNFGNVTNKRTLLFGKIHIL